MAAFDFPNSPSNGQTYSANGVTFTWNGSVWTRTSASTGAQGAQGAQGHQGAAGAQGAQGTAGSSTTINNYADNRVVTATGSSNTLNAESNVHVDGSGRLSLGNTQASTQYSGSNDLVIGNTTGEHGMTIITNGSNRGRLMFSRTYSADTQRYDGQILYDHATTTMNFYSNYTNNQNVAMQLGGGENQLFVGIDKGSTTTYNNRSAYFHRAGDNFISITGGSSSPAGIVFGDTIANNTGNYETYMHHTNTTNDFWIRVNQGSDNRHLKITQAGNVEIGNGDLVLASGHGISFAATYDGSNVSGVSASSELLDDYEEGSFTPILKRLMTNGVTETNFYTQGTRQGLYTRIGDRVWITGRIHWSGGSTGSGSTILTNLPFTINSGGANEIPIVCGYRSGWNYENITGYGRQNYNRFHIQYYDSNGSYNIPPSATASTGTYYFSANYQLV